MFEAVKSGRREGFGAEKPGVDCQLSGTLGILDFGPCLFYDFFYVFLDFYFFLRDPFLDVTVDDEGPA